VVLLWLVLRSVVIFILGFPVFPFVSSTDRTDIDIIPPVLPFVGVSPGRSLRSAQLPPAPDRPLPSAGTFVAALDEELFSFEDIFPGVAHASTGFPFDWSSVAGFGRGGLVIRSWSTLMVFAAAVKPLSNV
jgi:hypothetical protein